MILNGFPSKKTPMCDVVNYEGIEDELKCEQIEVKTEDGYYLQLFRVRKQDTPDDAKPVFLQHGLFGVSTNWAVRKGESLLHVLAN